MTQPAETFDTYDAVGLREDLEDIIYDVSPVDTPFMTMCDRIKATAKNHEWQKDNLAAAALNAAVEGDAASGSAITASERLHNLTMISQETIVISGTEEAVDKAGRSSEMTLQIARFGKKLKRDMEFGLTQNTAITVGNATTARQLGGLECWFQNVSSRASDGADCASTTGDQPDDDAQPTDGTQRALTEAMLKSVIQSCWNNGGDPSFIMTGGVNKQNISAFTGNATRMDRSEDMTLTAAFDVYRSDFGRHTVVPNRFQRSRNVFCLDPSLWAVAYLRPFRSYPLAKTGDNVQQQIVTEYTLVSRCDEGSGVIADLTTT